MVQVRLVYAIRSRSRRWAIRGLSGTHLAAQRVTRGRALGSVAGMPVLLLTTPGRRSGKARTTPLHVRSRRDRPRDRIERRCGSFARRVARSAADSARGRRDRDSKTDCRGSGGVEQERPRLWVVITATYAGYGRYQERTTRRKPVSFSHPKAGRSHGEPSPRAAAPPPTGTREVCLTAETLAVIGPRWLLSSLERASGRKDPGARALVSIQWAHA